MSNALNIIYMGTPDFSVPALQALINSHHNVMAVFTQPPRRKGRGKQILPSPVHELATQNNIPVFTPEKLKTDDAAKSELINLKPDVAIVAAYGQILSKEILDIPKHGCINIHASLLPRWRGASPIQHAVWKGDNETGISIMKMEEGLDTGPVIAMQSVPITSHSTAQTIHDEMANLGGNMIINVLDNLIQTGDLKLTKQDDNLSNYAPLLKKEDGKIDWTQTATEIDRQIRALNPWPGVYTENQEMRFKILNASPTDHQSSEQTGTLLNQDGHITCGNGTILKLELIKPENSKSMDINSAINGGYLKIGQIL